MSRPETTDLVCRGRRRELGAEERRRLEEALESSPEARLVNTMLAEFERESQVRPGDDVLLARIGARVLGAAPVKAQRPRRRALASLIMAAAVLLLGSLAWAWRASIETPRLDVPSAPLPSTHPRTAPAPAPAPARPRAAPAPAVDEYRPIPLIPQPADAGLDDVAVERAPRKRADPEVSGLFARANLLRRQGRSSEAAALYRLIIDEHPRAREAAPARLALAKLLRGKEPARALSQFRALAEQGGALRPEALWGIAESARSLGERGLEARALADLVREFPESPYADVARARLGRAQGSAGERIGGAAHDAP